MFPIIFLIFLLKKEYAVEYFVTEDGLFEYCYHDSPDYVNLTKIRKDSEDLTLPSTIQHSNKEYPVTYLVLHGSHSGTLNGSLTIPDTVTYIGDEYFMFQEISSIEFGSSVKSIGISCFSICKKLTDVVFPSSLETIGDYCFLSSGVTSVSFPYDSELKIIGSTAFKFLQITEISFPSSLIEIGDHCFSNTALTFIDFGYDSKLKTIQQYAFESTQLSGQIEFPESLEVIGASAFQNTKITSIDFHDLSNLTTIESDAFLGTSLRGEIYFPPKISLIGNNCFQGTKITAIYFQSTLLYEETNQLSIGEYAFEGTSLKNEINFPNNLTYIGQYCFANTNITNIEFYLDSSVTLCTKCFYQCKNLIMNFDKINARVIQSEAFSGCSSLKSIVIYENEEIEFHSFYQCSSLEEITIYQNENGNVKTEAISNCNALEVLIIKTPKIENNFIYNCNNLTTFDFYGINKEIYISLRNLPQLVEVIFNDGIYTFEDSFVDFNSLKIVNFYNSNITFKGYSFNNCPSLNSITNDKNSYIINIQSYAFYKCPLLEFECTNVLSMESHSFLESCDQSFTFTSPIIPSYSIKGSTSLKYIRISSTVTKISSHFIEKCPEFNSLEFLDPELKGNKLIIEDEAFWKMDTFEITSRLPERLITIGNESFSGCSKMTGSLFMPSELISIGSNAFAGCTGLNGILDFSNSNKLEIISSYAFLGCTSLCGTLSLPDSLKEIGAYAFTKCDFAGPLIIPDNVIIINQYAFALCSSFTGSLIIGSNVEYIGAYAFSECNGFNGQLEITTKVLKEIGNNAFFSCTSLKGTLNLPNTLVSIGNFAFFECKGLENKLVLPQSLVYIGNSAFAYCTGFTQVLEFPKNISYIGRNAFLQCKGFTKIYFDKTSAKSETITIGDKAFGNLKIKCLSNVPPTCKGNTTDDNRCYDSTGFGFVQESSSILAESCELSTAVEMIITLATAIAGSGVLGIVGSFVKEWFDNIYSVAKRITAIFETVIQESIEVFKKNKDANETIEITITEIKNYLSAETENPQFNLSCAKLKGLLEAAFVKEWPSVPYNIKTNVINNSFNDIDFDALMLRHKRERKEKRCACLKRLFSRKRKDDMMLSSESGASEMNLPLI